MQENYNTTSKIKGKHLTYTERLMIERWHNRMHLSNRKIAELLGKSHQTINNEIKRGLVDLTFTDCGFEYSSIVAQNSYNHLKGAGGKTDKWTPTKAEFITQKIKDKYSPEVISKLPNMPSYKTIYNWIHKNWIKGITKKHLIYPRIKKEKQPKTIKNIRKTDALSINDRPPSINNREEAGHFEIDLVILNHHKGKQLLTLTDRKTRYEIIRIIPDKTCNSVNKEMLKIIKSYNIKSITADNGSEFMRLDEVLKCPIYYTHPYASYERGTNENANRLIRRWLPKGTKTVKPKTIKFIENWINNYPRKIFNFKSSLELQETKNLFRGKKV